MRDRDRHLCIHAAPSSLSASVCRLLRRRRNNNSIDDDERHSRSGISGAAVVRGELPLSASASGAAAAPQIRIPLQSDPDGDDGGDLAPDAFVVLLLSLLLLFVVVRR